MSTSAKFGVTRDTRSISATSKGAVTRDGRIIRNGTVHMAAAYYSNDYVLLSKVRKWATLADGPLCIFLLLQCIYFQG